jgi:hypothetical protein
LICSYWELVRSCGECRTLPFIYWQSWWNILLWNHNYPSPEELITALRQNPDIPKSVDEYVWYLLHDLSVRNVYLDDLSLGVPIDWKDYFSDIIRRGSMLLPLQDSIVENGKRLEQYDDTKDALLFAPSQKSSAQVVKEDRLAWRKNNSLIQDRFIKATKR